MDETLKEIARRSVQASLGAGSAVSPRKELDESFVVQPPQTDLTTERLSPKSKRILRDKIDLYAKELNDVSARLDSAKRDITMPDASTFVSLKAMEQRLLNKSFLLGLHITNISDQRSLLAMDSLAYMRLERDWGTFDDWQKDFIACAMGTKCFAVTAYNMDLGRYINLIVDDNHPMPPSTVPVLVLCAMPELYVRDYLDDRKSYIFAMMKELGWEKIEQRVKRAEAAAKAFRSSK